MTKGILLNHWNQSDLRKILTKHAQILQISEATLHKTDLSVVKLCVGCEAEGCIPKEITVIIGSKQYSAKISIEALTKEPLEMEVLLEA